LARRLPTGAYQVEERANDQAPIKPIICTGSLPPDLTGLGQARHMIGDHLAAKPVDRSGCWT
jgi:hypothetical protein